MNPTTPMDLMDMLDKLYTQAVQGIPNVSPPIDRLADEYISKSKDLRTAAQSFIRVQITKCTASGFLSGLGGAITLPLAIPANMASVLYIQIRTIACLAHMGGYDIHCQQVRSLVFSCLADVSVDQVVKHVGIRVGTKLSAALIKKLPASVLAKINLKVGQKMMTKLSGNGLLRFSKAIPLIGGVVSGGFDLFDTKRVANRAYTMFINGNVFTLGKEEFRVIDVKPSELADKAAKSSPERVG